GDEPPLDQGAQHLAARDAADGFEGGAGHGLAIGNDRERLERRAAELLALARLVEPRERVRATRERHDAHAARDLLDAEGAPRALVLLVQRLDRGQHRAGSAIIDTDAQAFRQLCGRDRPVEREKNRFNGLREVRRDVLGRRGAVACQSGFTLRRVLHDDACAPGILGDAMEIALDERIVLTWRENHSPGNDADLLASWPSAGRRNALLNDAYRWCARRAG